MIVPKRVALEPASLRAKQGLKGDIDRLKERLPGIEVFGTVMKK